MLTVRSGVDVLGGEIVKGIDVGASSPRSYGTTAESASRSAIDIRLGANVGTFKAIDYSTSVGHVKGEIGESDQATHFSLGASIAYHFSP